LPGPAMAPQPMLTLALPGNLLYKELLFVDLEDVRTWRVTESSGHQASLASGDNADQFFQDMRGAHQVPSGLIYVSVAQDEAGRHCFLCLGDIAKALRAPEEQHLKFVPELAAKALRDSEGAVLLYARPASPPAGEGAAPGGAAAKLADGIVDRHHLKPTPKENELCPKTSPWVNYDVIPELSLGVTQKLILCDEMTLTRSLPDERIFEYLTLIVNCHENVARVAPGLYKIGACSTDRKPEVICQEVHKWYALGSADMDRANDKIQEKIWEALQSGTVAVHCLAGIHRAACIVACHFLWRHYVLGDHSIPDDLDQIYSCLIAQRPRVSPAYLSVLTSYKQHLQKRAASA